MCHSKFRLALLALAVAGGSAFSAAPALAAVSPLSLSLIPPVEFPPSDFTVAGLRMSVLWGKHRNVYGFDFGVIGNVTQQEFTGLAVSGVFNYTQGATHIVGLQLAGVANINQGQTRVLGFQVAPGFNSNTAEATIIGFELAGIANYCPHTNIYGAQIGLYNKALNVHGFQIGLLNFTDELHGIQIGLLNFNAKGLFAVAPILNAGF